MSRAEGGLHDDNSEVQAFLRDFHHSGSKLLRRGCKGAGNDSEDHYISKGILQANLPVERVEMLLDAVFRGSSERRPSANEVHRDYLRPFAILICIGFGEMISIFVVHNSFRDSALPLYNEPKDFPITTKSENIWDLFYKQQWRFCPLGLSFDMQKTLNANEILPIPSLKLLDQGSTASTYLIEVDREFDALDPHNKSPDDLCRPYVLKTFQPRKKKDFLNEREAFVKIRYHGKPPKNVVGYFGSFEREGVLNLILEYANQGNLDKFLQQHRPPSNLEERVALWENIFDVSLGINALHGHLDDEFKGFESRERNKGWHQDINPNNILVDSRSSKSVNGFEFKLADLGLSHFVIDSSAETTDRDSYGTTSYGHPDTYRDKKLQTCSLRVRQNVDLWSWGCVLSEVALWVCHGWEAVEAYRAERSSEVYVKTKKKEDLFHAHREILDVVKKVHADVQLHRLANDYVTPEAITMIENDLMKLDSAQSFPSAKHVYDKSKNFIVQWNSKMEEQSLTPLRIFYGLGSTRDTRTQPAVVSRSTQSRYSSRQLPPPPLNTSKRQDEVYPIDGDDAKMVTSASSQQPSADRQQGPLEPSPVPVRSSPKEDAQDRRHQQTVSVTLPLPSTPSSFDDDGDRFQGHGRWEQKPQGLRENNPQHLKNEENERLRQNFPVTEGNNRNAVPSLSIHDLLGIKRRESDYLKANPDRYKDFEPLRGRDHVVLVDVSNTMAEHREDVAEVLDGLCYLLKSCCLHRPYICFSDETLGPMRMPMDISSTLRKIRKHSCSGGDIAFESTFTSILTKHHGSFKKFHLFQKIKHPRSHPFKGPRKLSLYILTNAVWKPKTDLKPAIKKLAERLVDYDMAPHQTGIQFIQFGDHEKGTKRLKKLATELNWRTKNRLVDTTQAGGDVKKMLLGATSDIFEDRAQQPEEDWEI